MHKGHNSCDYEEEGNVDFQKLPVLLGDGSADGSNKIEGCDENNRTGETCFLHGLSGS